MLASSLYLCSFHNLPASLPIPQWKLAINARGAHRHRFLTANVWWTQFGWSTLLSHVHKDKLSCILYVVLCVLNAHIHVHTALIIRTSELIINIQFFHMIFLIRINFPKWRNIYTNLHSNISNTRELCRECVQCTYHSIVSICMTLETWNRRVKNRFISYFQALFFFTVDIDVVVTLPFSLAHPELLKFHLLAIFLVLLLRINVACLPPCQLQL